MIGNIRNYRLDFTGCKYVPLDYYRSLKSIRQPQKGDVLYSLVGATYGTPARVVEDRPFCVQRHIGILRPSPETISAEFLALVLRNRDVYNQATQCATGSAQPTVPLSGLRRIRIPLPPRLEQDAVVAAIEEQFSRLDVGVAALTSAQRRLAQLRNQGILTLIAGSGKKRLLGEVADIRLGRQRSPKDHTGPNMVPYLRAANVTWTGLDLTDVNEMNFSPGEVATFRLQRGDVLVSEASGSVTEVGKPALWDEELPVCCFQNTLLRLRSDGLLPEYLYYVMLALARSGEFARSSKGVGIHHLSKAGLANVMIEVPSREMQNELVSRIAAQQEHFSHLGAALSAGFRRAKLLRSSILSSAFAGHMVPQDPIGDAA
jgi:type I restriction enzyme S subunit